LGFGDTAALLELADFGDGLDRGFGAGLGHGGIVAGLSGGLPRRAGDLAVAEGQQGQRADHGQG